MRIPGDFWSEDCVRPERRLADLMAERLRVIVEPDDLRRLLIDHWSKVSMLAHRIHDEADRYAYLVAGDG